LIVFPIDLVLRSDGRRDLPVEQLGHVLKEVRGFPVRRSRLKQSRDLDNVGRQPCFVVTGPPSARSNSFLRESDQRQAGRRIELAVSVSGQMAVHEEARRVWPAGSDFMLLEA